VLPKSNSLKNRSKITTTNLINRIIHRTDHSQTKIKDEFSVEAKRDNQLLANAIS
jgi:hypothetical protein